MAVTDKNIRRWGKELAAEAAAFLHDDEKVIHYIDEHAHILCKSVAYQTFKLLEAKDSDNEARTFYLKIISLFANERIYSPLGVGGKIVTKIFLNKYREFQVYLLPLLITIQSK